MKKRYETLYHVDAKGNYRVWWMEQDGERYRMASGLEGGQITYSMPTVAEAKNVGRANATTAVQQATAEIVAAYKHKLKRKYSTTKDTAKRHNFVAPMLAQTWDEKQVKVRGLGHRVAQDFRWLVQPKLDGVRCLFGRHGHNSREGEPFFTVQHVMNELAPVLKRFNVVIDGELYNHEYKEDFNSLISMIKTQKESKLTPAVMDLIRSKVQFHVYDVFFPDKPHLTFAERYKFICGMFHHFQFNMIKKVPTFWVQRHQFETMRGRFFENGYEGIMYRDPLLPYEAKRSKALYKDKGEFITEEFPVLDILPGTGNWAGMAKTALLQLPNGKTGKGTFAGSREVNIERLRNKRKYIGGLARVDFQNYTPDGQLRFPSIKHLYGTARRTL